MKFIIKLSIPNDLYKENISNFDNTDFRIVSLLVNGYDNKKISHTLKIPLSTIQRRTRRILQNGLVNVEYTPNLKMLDIKKGLLYIYLNDGELRKTAEKISEMDGILSTSIHIGSSDVLSEFVYNDSESLADIIGKIKKMEGVEKVKWSEEIIKIPTKKENMMKSFRDYLENTNTNSGTGSKRSDYRRDKNNKNNKRRTTSNR